MAPTVLNTYRGRNQKRRKPWDKISRALKEIGNSQQYISIIDGSFVKINRDKTDVTVKGVGLTSKTRAKRKSLKDCSQKLLKTDSFKHTFNKGQSGSLSYSLESFCDTTFDQLRKAEPLQRLQPLPQYTSCTSSSGISEQVELTSNCSLFPAPCVTTRQNESSKKSNGSNCIDAEILENFRVTSTPKGANRKNKPRSPALSPIITEKSEANEVETQDTTSVHSNDRRVFQSSTSTNPASAQNDIPSVPLYAISKTTPSNTIELSSFFEPVQISVPDYNGLLKIIGVKDLSTPSENHDISKVCAVLSKDSQTEVKYDQMSLPTEKDDSLEIISGFKNLRTFDSHVDLGKDSAVFSKDIQAESNSEYQLATSIDVKQAIIDCESNDLSYKLIGLSTGFKGFDTQDVDIHSFAEDNRIVESNVQLQRGSNIPEMLYASTDMFADSFITAKNAVCLQGSSGKLASTVVPSVCDSNDSNSIKNSKDVLIQEPKRSNKTNSGNLEISTIYSCKCCISLTEKLYALNGVNISHGSRLNYDTSESINSSSYKCQGSSSRRCVHNSTNVSELVVSKHERSTNVSELVVSKHERSTNVSELVVSKHECASQTANSSENKSSEVVGRLDGTGHETSTSAIDAIKRTLPNLSTDASYQGTNLETDKQLQPSVRADTPSPGRPSCRRSHVVVPQNNEVRSRQASTSFRKVYSNYFGQMSPHAEDEEENETSPVLMSVPMRARQAVLHRCQQTEPIPFSQAFPDEFWDSCRKIGEGLYGEVFLSEAEDGVVFKVIPIEGDKMINEEPQKKYEEILSEIVIAMELSELRNGTRNNTSSFAEVQKCLCVKGRYPKPLIDLWEEYAADKGTENDCPAVFEDDQLYIILALANGGQDLEAFCFSSADQALSVLKQIACALAVAENALEFEHRDLHWGNVLIGPTSIKSVSFTINGEVFDIPTKGVKATIIDFTLSRMTYDGCCIFNDLARDPTLFTSEGDYQFEVYRLMRDTVKDDWRNFEPFTNLLWLHYLLHKMITMVNYRRTNTKIHQKGISEMKNLSDDLLSYSSCAHFVLTSMMK